MKKKLVSIKSEVLGTIIGAVVAAVLLLSGCAKPDEEKTEDMTAPVLEKIDEEGNVFVPGSDKNYLEAYADSEEELIDIVRTALEESNEDMALIDGKLTTYGVDFEIPEEFEAYEGRKDFYVTKRFPLDASCIQYSELEKNLTLQLMDLDEFESVVESAFINQYGEFVDLVIEEYTDLKIDGVPAIRTKVSYVIEDSIFTNLMYFINGTKTYVIIYSQTTDYDRMDLFEESATTIHIRK